MPRALLPFYIVDDDLAFGNSLQRVLKAKGYAAKHFESAEAFLNSVSSEQAGFAIVDIHMPDCDGFRLLRKMKDLQCSMPVIIITGCEDFDSGERAIREGAAGCLAKPFPVESLLELVRKLETE